MQHNEAQSDNTMNTFSIHIIIIKNNNFFFFFLLFDEHIVSISIKNKYRLLTLAAIIAVTVLNLFLQRKKIILIEIFFVAHIKHHWAVYLQKKKKLPGSLAYFQ